MEILSKIAEYTIEPIGRQVCYVIHCRTNIQKLQARVEELKAARDTIEIKVADAKTKGEKIQPDVRLWLKKVGEITTKTNALLDEESQAKLKCLHGFCPNLTSRHQLGRESTKLVPEVVEQIEKGGFPQVSCGFLRKEVWTVTNGDYQAFQSRIRIVKEIMDALKDCGIQRMGVCGVRGVGKTTLVKDVYKQASEDKTLFDNVVILMDVKKEPNPEAIQKKIVEQLSMDLLPDETIDRRASRLCAKIQGKKVLVILDDIQEKIDLEVLGLPRLSTCKILMTSRTPKVFSVNEMGAQKVFQLDLLVEEETWSLFKRMAGDVVEQNDRVRDVAIKIAKKCGGLPLLAVTVASALKGKKKLQAWKDALRRLRSFDKEESTDKQAYLALEWSYDQLEGKELKPVFLLCGLLVKKNHICVLDLFKCCMGLGLFKDLHTMEEAQDAMDTLVDKLKDSCLLLDSDSAGYVRMHDLVCDVAKWIAHKDHFVLSVEDGGELKKWPDKDFMKKCTKISLPHINIPPLSELPLECPELEMFCLVPEDESVVIPSNFFSKMQGLKVLDISNMNMPSLPSSLQYLKALQTLCLDDCKLGDITLLGQLSSLEILSLIHSNMEELPREIGQLTRLRLLDLSGCFRLKVIPHGVISSLVRLEDLRMRNCFNRWEIEGNASLSELKHLSQLYALEIHISNADILPANLFSHKIEKYNVHIGDTWNYPWKDPMDRVTLNTLKLRLTNKNTMGLDEGLKWLLKRSEDLSLDESVINVIQHLDAEDLKNLKHLQLKNSTVYNMNKAVFSKLVTFVVQGCDNLRALLSVSIARSLVHLTQIRISSCELMQEIISSPRDGSEEKDGILSRLQVLELNKLPKLVRFTTGNHIEFSALEELKIQDCYELVEFIWDNKVAMTNEDGRVGKEFGARVKEEEENLDVKSNTAVQYILFDKKAVFSKLMTFVVQGCDNLRVLLSVSTARSLVHLTQLRISSCELMQEIISSPRDGSEEKDGILPRLQVLELNKLPKLVRFTTGNHIEFSALEELKIQDCYELVEFIWDNKVAMTNEDGRVGKEFGARVKEEEENLDVKSNTAVQYILFDKKEVFSKLVTFVVQGCDNLRALLSVSTARSLVHLTQLRISSCELMQEIISSPRDGSEEKDGILSWLQVLELNKLPKLVRFTTGNHIEFSALEELKIQDCYELAEFIWDNKVAMTNENGRVGKEFGARVKEEEENLDVKSNTAVQYILFDKKAVFSKLVTFVVQGCDNLRALLSVSTARSLVHLTQLRISSCELMQEIISSPRDDSEEKDGILPRLQVLELNKLPKLVRFTTGNHIEFSALEELKIEDCYELAEFIWDNKVAMTNEDGRVGKEFGARVKEEEENLDVKSNTAVQYILFDKKVGFPSLERLSIKGTSLKALWHAQLAPNSFRRLKQVVVRKCDKLISLFCSSLMGKLNALKTLEIEECKALEVIFELHGRSKVEEIHVDTLVPHDRWKPFDCQNLHSVNISRCESLKQIFPASVATCLQNLTWLDVWRCSVLKEIIGEEEEREGAETISPYFVFPKVTWVSLKDVPRLSSLYPKTHVSHWPLLKFLDFEAKRRTFATESSILVGGRGFFSINLNQDSFPELESLLLRDMDIWNGPPPAIGSVFGKLKSIIFCGNCAPFSNQASFLFLQRLPNLEEIKLWFNDSCKEIFVNQGISSSGKEIHDDDNDAVRSGALPRVTTLSLECLPELIHLGNDDPRSLVFPNLETLQVKWCRRLKSIESSAISFRNLTTLEVNACFRLAYLTSYSVAKSFVQLTTLKVEWCDKIVVIVSSNEDDDADAAEGNEIPFGRLQHLELNWLESLQGFYTGNCTLKFPPAMTLIVKECPIKLKISSDGVLLTEIADEFK